jgi:hypothetical protein
MIVYIVTYFNANDDYYNYVWGVFDTEFLAESQRRKIKMLNPEHCGIKVEQFEVMSAC